MFVEATTCKMLENEETLGRRRVSWKVFRVIRINRNVLVMLQFFLGLLRSLLLCLVTCCLQLTAVPEVCRRWGTYTLAHWPVLSKLEVQDSKTC